MKQSKEASVPAGNAEAIAATVQEAIAVQQTPVLMASTKALEGDAAGSVPSLRAPDRAVALERAARGAGTGPR